MITFLKANVASIVASALDYVIFFLLVHFGWMEVAAATVTGMICGGVLNFAMGRTWVFGARDQGTARQVARYILVWVGNIVLTTAGVYVLVKGLDVHYMVAKVGVSVLMGVSYNYILQKRFVFNN
jgi:putative flippase GtrA